MPRPQFTIRALLALMLVVAAFFGGMAVQGHLDQPLERRKFGTSNGSGGSWAETMTLRDGTRWTREP